MSEAGTPPSMHTVSPRTSFALKRSVRSNQYTALPVGMSLITSRREVQSPSNSGLGVKPASMQASISFLSEGQ